MQFPLLLLFGSIFHIISCKSSLRRKYDVYNERQKNEIGDTSLKLQKKFPVTNARVDSFLTGFDNDDPNIVSDVILDADAVTRHKLNSIPILHEENDDLIERIKGRRKTEKIVPPPTPEPVAEHKFDLIPNLGGPITPEEQLNKSYSE